MSKPISVRVIFILIGCLTIAGCGCGAPGIPVLATSAPNDDGYLLNGVHDFEGILRRPVDAEERWVLDWRFTFPTGGYSVEDVELVVLESFPEQVHVTYTVKVPAPWEFVTQAISEVAGTERIDVSSDALFDIRIVEACNHGIRP